MAGGTRRTATVLFTDLVASTEQRSRLGDDVADEIRRAHDRLVGDAVLGADGEVVKSTGDGLLAVFGSAADALDATVAAQRAVARHNRGASEQLGVRAGLAVGDVVVEDDGDVFGTPVVEAGRLCDRADGGQVVCSEFVRALAGSRVDHQFSSMGELELKGLPAPVLAHLVDWQERAESLPLPPVVARGGTFDFAGRTSALDELTRLWKRSRDEGPLCALVSGEPGAGKTRLVAELARRSIDEGAIVLAGRCDDGLGVPHQPFVSAFGHWFSHAAESDRDDLLGDSPGELQRLYPALGQAIPGLAQPTSADPETERYLLYEAVTSWLRRLSETAPVLLVVDDLHWATTPTLHLLRHVLRAEPFELLVAATYRDTDLDRTHPLADLLAVLRRDGRSERVRLSGFSVDDVFELMTRAAGHELDEPARRLGEAIHAETDGNPFFVESVLRHLAETGGIAQEDGRWRVTVPVDQIGIPEGVREVVGRRLAQLSDDTDELLHLCALAAEEFDVAVIAAAADRPDDDLDRSLQEADAAGLITLDDPSPGRARFAHALVRASLMEEVPTHRRVRLHRRLGEAIETVHADRLDEHLPALARHFVEAAPAGDVDRAVDYLRRAAAAAEATLALEEVVGFLDTAIDLVGGDAGRTRAELLLDRGRVKQYVGRERGDAEPLGHADLVGAADLAESIGAADILAEAALAYGGAYLVVGVGRPDATRLDLVDRALDALGPKDPGRRADLLIHLANELVASVDHERRRAAADEALTLAREVGDPDVLVSVLLRRGNALMSTPEQLVGDVDEAFSLLDRVRSPILPMFARWHRTNTCLRNGDVEAARRALDDMQERVARTDRGLWHFAAAMLDYSVQLWGGDVRNARATLERTTSSSPGDFDPRWTATMLERVEAPARPPGLGGVPRAGVHALDLGDRDAADGACDLLDRVAFGDDPDPLVFLATASSFGELRARLRRSDGAADGYERILDRSGTTYPGWNLPSSMERERAWWAAAAGALETAERHLAAAVAYHGERGSPTNVAEDHRSWAWIRHLAGDDAGARDHLAEARAALGDIVWPRFDQQVEVLEASLDGGPDHGV